MRTMPLYQGSSQERNSTRYEEQKNNGQIKSTCAFKPVVSTMPQQPLLPTRMTSVVTTAQAMNVGSIYQESPRKLPLQLQYNVRPLVSQPTTTNLQPASGMDGSNYVDADFCIVFAIYLQMFPGFCKICLIFAKFQQKSATFDAIQQKF